MTGLEFFPAIRTAFSLIFTYWWIITPILLFLGVVSGIENLRKRKYAGSLNWVLLEIKSPPDVERSPKITEQFFAGIHGVYVRPVKWQDRIFKGRVLDWFSFEIVGTGGDIHFYIRTQEQYRNIVESQLFAQYPEVEISLVDDYVDSLPSFLPDDEHDLFGSEVVLVKDDVYPIKTYPLFEEQGGIGEAKRIDPMAAIAEALSTLKNGEHIWLQLLVRPVGGKWAEKGKEVVDKLMGRKVKIKEGLFTKIVFEIDKIVPGSFTPKSEQKEEQPSLLKLTPGEQEIVQNLERKIAKIGFECGIRFLYIARRDMFHRAHVSAIIGVLKQFASQSLNMFRADKDTITKTGWFLRGWREFSRKWKLFLRYKSRVFIKKPFIFNTEELATVFHLPGLSVKAPMFPRVEAKKGQPPAGLPIK